MDKVIGSEQAKELIAILKEYHAGLQKTKSRIIAAENWWKMRNTIEEQKTTKIGGDGAFAARSGWLHNVLVNKHADAMESYPEPNILPREPGDKNEASNLTSIIPCVLEQNKFESTYSDAMWSKIKTGTGVYKITWDAGKLNGLGDIAIVKCNLLNLYWEPGVTDIQQSKYFFHTELVDKDILQERYPELRDRLKSNTFVSSKFLYDDTVTTDGKATVVDAYYHKVVDGVVTVQYCKFVEDVVLYATENDTTPVEKPNVPEESWLSPAQAGLYDHGHYPYVFDALFPIEGSPCGYGYVDVCISPQTEIDLLKTAFVKNAMAGATPRFWKRGDGGVNEEEFLDTSKPIVHVNGTIDDNALKKIDHNSLDGNYINVMQATIQELRETSGNTETATGTTSSGVTAASAIAALQEASGKGSRDSTLASYRAYSSIIEMVIELIRQFYSSPRQFRIVGEYGYQKFITYSNQGLQMQSQGEAFGNDMGFRKPVFDIKISAQKRSIYTKITQNEMALQFFQLGFFNPQMADQALMCLDLMDFDGKDQLMQKLSQQGTMQQKLIQYMQLALTFAQQSRPDMVQGLSQDIQATMMALGIQPQQTGATASAPVTDSIGGMMPQEHGIVSNARERANEAAQPDAGRVVADRK